MIRFGFAGSRWWREMAMGFGDLVGHSREAKGGIRTEAGGWGGR